MICNNFVTSVILIKVSVNQCDKIGTNCGAQKLVCGETGSFAEAGRGCEGACDPKLFQSGAKHFTDILVVEGGALIVFDCFAQCYDPASGLATEDCRTDSEAALPPGAAYLAHSRRLIAPKPADSDVKLPIPRIQSHSSQ